MNADQLDVEPFAVALATGEPFLADGSLLHAFPVDAIAAGWRLLPLGLDWLAVPADRDVPIRWHVSTAGTMGSTVTAHYELSRDRSCYELADQTQTGSTSAGQGSAVDPDVAARAIAAGAAVVERARPADTIDAPELPLPAHPTQGAAAGGWDNCPTWRACTGCAGLGRVVVADVTAQLRRAGHPYTVVAPCPRCQGSGGLLS